MKPTSPTAVPRPSPKRLPNCCGSSSEHWTIAPTSIGPTWKGGVTAEWHANGFDLEIECDPEGNKTYYFNGPEIEEYEGPIEDDLTRLQRHFRMLPDHRE